MSFKHFFQIGNRAGSALKLDKNAVSPVSFIAPKSSAPEHTTIQVSQSSAIHNIAIILLHSFIADGISLFRNNEAFSFRLRRQKWMMPLANQKGKELQQEG